jgi:hypothetical protein
MSKRLRERVRKMERELGKVQARTKLCQSIDKSERTLLLWLQKGVPTANDAVSLALACGCSEGEAWELARDSFPLGAKRTA